MSLLQIVVIVWILSFALMIGLTAANHCTEPQTFRTGPLTNQHEGGR